MSYFFNASRMLQVSEKDKNDFLESIKLTTEEAKKLERNTTGHATAPSSLRYSERRKRLTASRFETVCKLRYNDDRHKIALNILHRSDSTHTNPGSIWGQTQEEVARRELEAAMNVEVKECGLFVCTRKPWLGATPDGLIGNDTIVEIKCPYLAREMSPLQAARQGLIQAVRLENDKIMLKDRHHHMYQIQGQLHITGRSKCIFVLWTPKGMSTEVILKSDEFWKNEMEPKLDQFYMRDLLPLLCAERNA